MGSNSPAIGTSRRGGGTGGTGPVGPQGPAGAAGAAGTPGNIKVDSVNTSGVTLSGLASAGYNDGQGAYAVTVGDVFRLQQSALAVDNITVVTATGKAGYQWVRLRVPSISNQTIAAWFIDPTNGSDEAAGTTSATAIKTLAELARRWYGLMLSVNVTVNILGNCGTVDPAFNFNMLAPNSVTFVGSLGATTGFGGAAINNTLFTGLVTTFTAASATPTADDIELNDATIPVSFTASGLMVAGVIFKQAATTFSWYALKDLGGKTIRITVPMNLSLVPMSNALANGSAYVAYQMWTFPQCNYGAAASKVALDSLLKTGNSNAGHVGFGPARTRIWEQESGVSVQRNATMANCMFAPIAPATNVQITAAGKSGIFVLGGGSIGNGSSLFIVGIGTGAVISGMVTQGRSFECDDGAYISFEGQVAVHDYTLASGGCVTAANGGNIGFNNIVQAGAGLSGKGNTTKLLKATSGATISYSNNTAAPPCIGGSTTDVTPVTLGTTNYALVAIPAVVNTTLHSNTMFP